MDNADTLPEPRAVVTFLSLVAGRLAHNISIDLTETVPRDGSELTARLDRAQAATEDALQLLNAARALYRRVTVDG